MAKILLLLVIGLVVWAVIRGYRRSLDRRPDAASDGTIEKMVKCAQCGVNMPVSEAIRSGETFYCTPEHQKLGPS